MSDNDVSIEDRNDVPSDILKLEHVSKEEVEECIESIRTSDRNPVIKPNDSCTEAENGHDWNRIGTGKRKVWFEQPLQYDRTTLKAFAVQPAIYHTIKYERWRCPCGKERVNIIKYLGRTETTCPFHVPDDHIERVETDMSFWEWFRAEKIYWTEGLPNE